MAEKKVSPPPLPKTGVQEPAEIAFDFEDLIAAAVAAITHRRTSKAKNHPARSSLGFASSAHCGNALLYLISREIGRFSLCLLRFGRELLRDFIAA